MIESTRGPTAVTIIYIIATAILLVVLLLGCLGTINQEGNKSCLYLAVICWVIYSCFFWAAFTLII